MCACRGLSVQVAEHDRVSTDKCLRDDVCERDECADVPGLLVESDHGQCTSHCERLDGTSVCAVCYCVVCVVCGLCGTGWTQTTAVVCESGRRCGVWEGRERSCG